MAKKVVATLQGQGKSFSKIIRVKKSDKTGAYFFKEETVPNEKVKEVLAKK